MTAPTAVTTVGFLYDGDGVTGNYGLMDQEEALRWVQVGGICVVATLTILTPFLLRRPTLLLSVATLSASPFSARARVGDKSSQWARLEPPITLTTSVAGAMSIASHLSRKDNRDLYSAAIMECVPGRVAGLGSCATIARSFLSRHGSRSDPFGLPFRDHAAGMARAKQVRVGRRGPASSSLSLAAYLCSPCLLCMQTATKSGCAASTDVRNWSAVEDCWAGLSVDDVLATQQVRLPVG